MALHTEHELLFLFGKDREKAFRLFFDSYYIMLCDYVLLFIDDFEEAEDIVQSFFVQFWEEHLEDKIKGSLKNYCLACIRNAAFKRKGDSEALLSLADTDDWIFESQEDVLEEQNEIEKRLKTALEKLSVKEYDALKTVIIDEKKYIEASKELDISVNTLKTYLKRAIKKLKESDILIFFILFVTHFICSLLFMVNETCKWLWIKI